MPAAQAVPPEAPPTRATAPRATPFASISLDLDDEWSYLKTHGQEQWRTLPSFLPVVVPRILAVLRERNLRITFLVVGQDAALDANRDLLRAIAEDGHEIGNHSFSHEPWLHRLGRDEMEAELARTERAIEAATGVRPRGFRGPGFSLSRQTLELLQARDYAYDATVFPNLLNPLARAYYFATSQLSAEERERRRGIFGSWRDGLGPLDAFQWALPDGPLLEIPVTTVPGLRVPFHMSYLAFLAGFAKPVAILYARAALRACRVTKTPPSFLLHAVDFLGADDCPRLAFFPGMRLGREAKLTLVSEVLDLLADRFEPVTLAEHARRAARLTAPLRALPPDLPS